MARFSAMINQFNGGYMDRRLNARTNLDNWPNCCKEIVNFIPTVWGGNKFRGGTEFVKKTEKSHLIPFVFNNSIAYVVEFADKVCYFYRNGKPVLDENGEVFKLESIYSYDSITNSEGGCTIKYQQSADVLYLATGAHPLQKLVRDSENHFFFSSVDLLGPFAEKEYIDPNFFKLNYDTVEGVEKWYFEYVSDGSQNVLETTVIEGKETSPIAASPTTSSTWAHIWILEEGEEPHLYDDDYRTSVSSDFTEGKNLAERLNLCLNNMWSGSGIACVPATDKSCIFKTKADSFYKEKYEGKRIYIELQYLKEDGTVFCMSWDFIFPNKPPLSYSSFKDSTGKTIRLYLDKEEVPEWEAKKNYDNGSLAISDGKIYMCAVGGESGTKKPVHSNGYATDGVLVWRFLNFGYIDAIVTSEPSESKIYINFRNTEENRYWRPQDYKYSIIQFSLFGGKKSENFPSSVFFYKDRLGLAINTPFLPKVAFSQTADYENFDPLVGGETIAESAILFDIVSGETDLVSWCVAKDDVIVATESSFSLISSASTADPFGPENVKVELISSGGASYNNPILVGGQVVFSDEKRRSLQTFGFEWEADSYKNNKISWVAETLFEEGIKSISYQKDPDSIVWCLTNRGNLISYTIESSQSISAFSYHRTDGEILSICTIPSFDGTYDELWANVRRKKSNGDYEFFIELFKQGTKVDSKIANSYFNNTEEKILFDKEILENSWFVDCGKIFISEFPTNKISGLDHLEGREVCGIVDGKCFEKKIVSGGEIVFDENFNKAIVGLPYEGYFVPNSINAGAQAGASQGKVQRVHSATIRVFRSRDFKCGDGVRMKDVIVSRNGVAGEGVLTGDVRIAFPGTYSNRYSEDTSAEIVIKQDKPYPLCVNGLILDMETYDA